MFARSSLFSLAVAGFFTGPTPAADPADFERMVAPFLAKHCVGCHGPAKQAGQVSLHKLTGQPGSDGVQIWETVLDQLRTGAMPPADKPKPVVAERDKVIGWITARLAESAVPSTPLVYPDHGNRLPHDRLFGTGVAAAPGASPARIWRFAPRAYEAAVCQAARITGFQGLLYAKEKDNFTPPWGLDGRHGFKDYAAVYRVDEPETELLINNATEAARKMVGKKGRFAGESKPFLVFAGRTGEPTPAEANTVVTAAVRQILRRDPSPDEADRYAKLLTAQSKSVGREAAVQTLLAAVFLHPELVYRFELGAGTPDAHGRVRLAPSELASAIALALGDAGPDTALREAAAAGRLATPDDVRREVGRLLDDPKTAKPRLLRFFQEYFEYTEAADVFKDGKTLKAGKITGGYFPAHLVADTDALVLHVLAADKNVLGELLTTTKSFVAEPRAAVIRRAGKGGNPFKVPYLLNQHYNLDANDWQADLPVVLPAEQRAGVLTQPSWLIAHSTNFENHAILRGKWVRERLLGGSIPDTPITVEAKLPDEPHQPLRERMRVTRAEYCWKCHRNMDPLGFPFEMYDHFGRFRTEEVVAEAPTPPARGKKPATRAVPVDASGEILDSGDKALDGKVKNAVEMVGKLAKSDRVRQVFVRHAFRFWMGRNETPADAPTLRAADAAYQNSGGSMKALITALLTSDPFLYRKPLGAAK